MGVSFAQQIRNTEKRLSNEIAGAYSLHDERFSDLEKRISAIEQRLRTRAIGEQRRGYP